MLLLIVPVFNGLPARPEVAVRQSSIRLVSCTVTLGIYQVSIYCSILAECSRENDCYPDNMNITETSLIDCIQGVCLCYPCFQFNSTTEKCSVSKCFTYEPINDQCIDNRKSQKEAFLFSFFFSSLGVANFYIGDVTLGISQLMITVAFLSLCYCCLCFSCCIISYEDSCCTRCFGEVSY